MRRRERRGEGRSEVEVGRWRKGRRKKMRRRERRGEGESEGM